MTNSQEITRLLSSPPARKIGRSSSSMTGAVATRFGYAVPHESFLERNHTFIFDFDLSVSAIKSQPLAIKYIDADGVKRTYYPDLLVCFHPVGRRRDPPPPWLCEVKYRDQLISKRDEFLPEFLAAHQYARKNGMRFKILTDTAINSDYLANIIFLRRYRYDPRTPEIEAILERTLRTLGESTPESVLAASFHVKNRRMEAVAPLWQMVLSGMIKVDLSTPLTMVSPMRLAD